MTFHKLLEELKSDFGRINIRERMMLRRAYDAVPDDMHVYHKVNEWDTEHRYYAYKTVLATEWSIGKLSRKGYPKCNYIGFFATEDDVKYFLKNRCSHDTAN